MVDPLEKKYSVRSTSSVAQLVQLSCFVLGLIACQGPGPEQRRTQSVGADQAATVDDKLNAGENTEGNSADATGQDNQDVGGSTEPVMSASDYIAKDSEQDSGQTELLVGKSATDSVERQTRVFADPTTSVMIEAESDDSEDATSSSEDADAQVVLPISIGLVAAVGDDLTDQVIAKIGRNSASDKVLDETNLEQELADEIDKIEVSPEVQRIQSVLIQHIGRIYKNLGREGFFRASSIDVRVGTPRSFRLRSDVEATFENQEVAAAVVYHLPELAEYSQAVDFYTAGPDAGTVQKTTHIQFKPHPMDPTLPLMEIDTWVRVELIPGFASWVRVQAKYDAVSGDVQPTVNWLPGSPESRTWDQFKNLETEFSSALVY